MKRLDIAQRICFSIHIASLLFGLAGLLIVLPNTDFIMSLPEIGQRAFQWSMAGGGAVYMVSGAIAVAIYAYRSLGLWHALTFMLPALVISMGAELVGTGTGFPFGEYHYLSGLGYKVMGRVPFTIPLSWFYLGFSAYLLAYVGLAKWGRWRWPGAIALGALMLTAWDFVLDPAMSQTTMPFWAWDQEGAFFGMPYQNFAGWFGTGVIFMGIATLLWQVKPLVKAPSQAPSKAPFSLDLPLGMYISNFVFAMVISIDGEIYPPIFLGLLLGVLPAVVLYGMAGAANNEFNGDEDRSVGALIPKQGDV